MVGGGRGPRRGLITSRSLGGMPVPLKPLCEAVDCRVELPEMPPLEKIAPNVYIEPEEMARPAPSLFSADCPRRLWYQYRVKAKPVTEEIWRYSALGRALHERYERYLREVHGALTEVAVERDGVVGIADAVLPNGEVVEIKSAAPKEGHRKQLEAYLELFDAPSGYLVYPHKVVRVRRRAGALAELKALWSAVAGPSPPPPAKDCHRCKWLPFCVWAARRIGAEAPVPTLA